MGIPKEAENSGFWGCTIKRMVKRLLNNSGFGGLIFVSFERGRSLHIQEIESLKGGSNLAEILFDTKLHRQRYRQKIVPSGYDIHSLPWYSWPIEIEGLPWFAY